MFMQDIADKWATTLYTYVVPMNMEQQQKPKLFKKKSHLKKFVIISINYIVKFTRILILILIILDVLPRKFILKLFKIFLLIVIKINIWFSKKWSNFFVINVNVLLLTDLLWVHVQKVHVDMKKLMVISVTNVEKHLNLLI